MCGSLVGFAPAPGDDETAGFLSKAGGMVGSMRVNASDDPQGGPARKTIIEHEEKLWPPEKIRSLPEFHGLVWRMGRAAPQPVACPPYWELPECEGRYDPDPYHPGKPPVVFGKRRGKLSKVRAAVMAAAVIAGGVWLSGTTSHLPACPPPMFHLLPRSCGRILRRKIRRTTSSRTRGARCPLRLRRCQRGAAGRPRPPRLAGPRCHMDMT
jgi:hypothetical protein